MNSELFYLILTAITISLIHTLTGPDHYLPFIALSKANKWTIHKTILWTVLCGLGHVGSSVVIALGGVAIGWSFCKIEWLEEIRGGIAGWAMLFTGVIYLIYAFIQMQKDKAHKHFETYDEEMYVYEHRDSQTIIPAERRKVTPWVMFIVFLLGPCEPLIPLLSFPAAKQSFIGVTILVAVFSGFTILTMVTIVLLAYYGIGFLKTQSLEKYTHVLAAVTIVVSGTGMLFMGW